MSGYSSYGPCLLISIMELKKCSDLHKADEFVSLIKALISFWQLIEMPKGTCSELLVQKWSEK